MIDNPWFALAAWLLSYLADYYLTLYSARIYRQGAKDHFTFDGSLELTPCYQAGIDKLAAREPAFHPGRDHAPRAQHRPVSRCPWRPGVGRASPLSRWLALRLSAVDLFAFAALSSPAVGSWPAAPSPAR